MSTKYDIFISYSRRDLKVVREFVDGLCAQMPDLVCFFDVAGIEYGEESDEKIIDAIDNSSYVLYFLSPNSMKSKWTKEEVMYAKNTNIKVIPLLLQGAEMKGWFLFKFGRVDYIDSTSQQHVDKLLKNLSSWTGKAISEAPLPATVVESPTVVEQIVSETVVEEVPTVMVEEVKEEAPKPKKKAAPRPKEVVAPIEAVAIGSGIVVYDIFMFELDADEHTATLVDIRADWTNQQLPASVVYAGAEYALTKIALKPGFSEYTVEAEEISIPEGVKCIGDNAFAGCFETQYFILPNSLEKIEENAFSCSGVKSITIPEGITSIEDLTFSSSDIASIVLPSSLTKIGSMAFKGCQDLNNIIVPEGVKVIEWSAFENCKNLKSITLPSSITNIGRDAFAGCKSLEEIVIPQGSKAKFKKMTGISFLLSFKLMEK